MFMLELTVYREIKMLSPSTISGLGMMVQCRHKQLKCAVMRYMQLATAHSMPAPSWEYSI